MPLSPEFGLMVPTNATARSERKCSLPGNAIPVARSARRQAAVGCVGHGVARTSRPSRSAPPIRGAQRSLRCRLRRVVAEQGQVRRQDDDRESRHRSRADRAPRRAGTGEGPLLAGWLRIGHRYCFLAAIIRGLHRRDDVQTMCPTRRDHGGTPKGPLTKTTSEAATKSVQTQIQSIRVHASPAGCTARSDGDAISGGEAADPWFDRLGRA